MTEPATLNQTAVVDAYIAAWNVATEQRVAALDQAFATDGYYCDGMSEVVGSADIAAMIDATHQQVPGAAVERISPVDAHHRQALSLIHI